MRTAQWNNCTRGFTHAKQRFTDARQRIPEIGMILRKVGLSHGERIAAIRFGGGMIASPVRRLPQVVQGELDIRLVAGLAYRLQGRFKRLHGQRIITLADVHLAQGVLHCGKHIQTWRLEYPFQREGSVPSPI